MKKNVSMREKVLLAIAIVLAVGVMYFFRSKLSAGDIHKTSQLDTSIASAKKTLPTIKIPVIPVDPSTLDRELKEVNKKIDAEKQRAAKLRLRFTPAEAELVRVAAPARTPSRPRVNDDEAPAVRPVLLRRDNAGVKEEPLPTVPREQIERSLREELLRIARIERDRANGNTGSLQDLKVSISSLARDSGLHVLEHAPHVLNQRRPASSSVDAGAAPAAKKQALPQDRLDPLTMYRIDSRPLQILRVEASYAGLRRFLIGLSSLPRQVVVIQFDVEIIENSERARGPLKVKLLLGL